MVNKVSYFTDLFQSTITRPNNTTTYTLGDVICDDNGSIFTFGSPLLDQTRHDASDDAVLREQSSNDGRSVTVEKLKIVSSANQTSLYLGANLLLFSADPGVGDGSFTDNAACAITDAELIQGSGKHYLGFIHIPATAWIGIIPTTGANGNATAQVQPSLVLNFPEPSASVTGQIWGLLLAANAYVPVAEEALAIGLGFAKD